MKTFPDWLRSRKWGQKRECKLCHKLKTAEQCYIPRAKPKPGECDARYYVACKECTNKHSRAHRESTKAFNYSHLLPYNGEKCCTKCGENKPLKDFPRNNTKPGGHGSNCRTCNYAASAKWKIKTKTLAGETVADCYLKHALRMPTREYNRNTL